jgi:ribosomal protein S18 acetylase RimI-like enzyme
LPSMVRRALIRPWPGRPRSAGADYAGPVRTAVTITELARADFLANIPAQLAIYGAAMDANPYDLPGRQVIMERHAGHPGLRALAAIDEQSQQMVAFAYCFRGAPGQWWHDVVWSAVAATSGVSAARDWLDDTVEIAEVHVHPDFQARGIGRQLVSGLTAGRAERTAVLSTRDAASPARRLYRQLGFTDLLTAFVFPGGGPPYAVMGALLPLAGTGAAVP